MFNKNNNKSEKDNYTPNNESHNNGTTITENRGDQPKMNGAPTNMISERSEIIGTLKSRRDIRIAGKVDGGVEAEGKVIIESTGFIDGTINSEVAVIAGKVKGDIHVADKLTLEETAVVNSDIYVKNFCMKEGAIFNGTCHMNEEEAIEETASARFASSFNEDKEENDTEVQVAENGEDKDEEAAVSV